MAKNNTWFIAVGLIMLYLIFPPFQDTINKILGGGSIPPVGETGVMLACSFDTVEMTIVDIAPNTEIHVDGVNIGIMTGSYTLTPGDKVELYSPEGEKYWEEEVPCNPSFPLSAPYPQLINTSTIPTYTEGIDYGAGGMILPELDETIYDFESLEDLNLDI